MAFKDFVKANGWKVSKENCKPREEYGHTVRIGGTETAVTVSCDDSHTHLYIDPVYQPDPEMITGPGYQITLAGKSPGGKDQIRCDWTKGDGTQTPSWTAEDKG
jgi:hypothetical protein